MRSSIHYVLYRAGLEPATTQTTEAERECIARYSQGKRFAAEIGVWHGVTTQRIARSLAEGGRVFAVDNYVRGRLGISFPELVALKETEPWRNRVEFVKATGEEAAALLAATIGPLFEFVFIDGDHSYEGIRRDWQAWAPLVANGGFVALHDSRSYPGRDLSDAGSAIFTGEVILKDESFRLLEVVDSLTVVQRIR